MRYTSVAFLAGTVPTLFAGTTAVSQLAKTCSSFGIRSAIAMSPTTTRVALFGRTHAEWKSNRP